MKTKRTTPSKVKVITPDSIKKELLALLKEQNVRFLRLQFTDILGVIKNVEIPDVQFEKALNNEILFDGSSIDGFSRIEESDMLLYPDPATFRVFPWVEKGGKVARIICDVYHPDNTPFEGCPRMALKEVVSEAKALGYTMAVGPEAEFFLFQKNEKGEVVTDTHDKGSYFDLTPIDRGEDARNDSGDQKLAHRLIGHDRVNHHGDRGRDHGGEAAGAGDAADQGDHRKNRAPAQREQADRG